MWGASRAAAGACAEGGRSESLVTAANKLADGPAADTSSDSTVAMVLAAAAAAAGAAGAARGGAPPVFKFRSTLSARFPGSPTLDVWRSAGASPRSDAQNENGMRGEKRKH